MKVLEGTPEEIAAYEATQSDTPKFELPDTDPVSRFGDAVLDVASGMVTVDTSTVGNGFTVPAEEVEIIEQLGEPIPEEEAPDVPEEISPEEDLLGKNWLTNNYVLYTRAFSSNRSKVNPARTHRVVNYLDTVETELDQIWVTYGTSTVTADQFANYLVVRDATTGKLGALSYVWPHNGNVKFRLRPEDCNGHALNDRIRKLNVGPKDPYRVQIQLDDEIDVGLAVDLTAIALKVARKQSSRK